MYHLVHFSILIFLHFYFLFDYFFIHLPKRQFNSTKSNVFICAIIVSAAFSQLRKSNKNFGDLTSIMSKSESDSAVAVSAGCSGCSFVIGLVFIIVGAIYNAQGTCDNSAVLFLLIHGSLLVIAGLTPGLPICIPLVMLVALVDFVTVLWGMFAVFGAYSTWQFDSPNGSGYCPQVPFLLAFIDLIFYAILLVPLLICFPCICIVLSESN